MPPSLPLSCPPRVMEGSQAGRRGPAPEVLRWLQALRPGTAAQRPASYFSLPHPTRVHYVHSLPLDRRGNWVVALDPALVTSPCSSSALVTSREPRDSYRTFLRSDRRCLSQPSSSNPVIFSDWMGVGKGLAPRLGIETSKFQNQKCSCEPFGWARRAVLPEPIPRSPPPPRPGPCPQHKLKAEGKPITKETISEFAWETLKKGQVVPGYGHGAAPGGGGPHPPSPRPKPTFRFTLPPACFESRS